MKQNGFLHSFGIVGGLVVSEVCVYVYQTFLSLLSLLSLQYFFLAVKRKMKFSVSWRPPWNDIPSLHSL